MYNNNINTNNRSIRAIFSIHTSISRISLFGFIERIENLIFVQWIFSTVSTISLIIYYISNSIKKEDKNIVRPTIIMTLIIILTLKLFKNNTYYNNYLKNTYPYIILFMFIIFYAPIEA